MILWIGDFLTRWHAMTSRVAYRRQVSAYLRASDGPDGFTRIADRHWAGLSRRH